MTPSRPSLPNLARQVRHISAALIAALLAIMLTAGLWGEVRRGTLLERPDNPRRILNERRVARGTIYDRDGATLAESVGPPGEYRRHYPYQALAPVLGYVSALYGTAGVEAAVDGVLHGDAGYDEAALFWREHILGSPPPGRDARLSIDLRLQTLADEALGPRSGAIVLLDAATGEILALASHPTFDPNRLDEDWPRLIDDENAPLLNRAAQGLYQPGGAIWPLVVAGAIRDLSFDMETPFLVAGEPASGGAQPVSCRVDPRRDEIRLSEALRFGCPGPIAAVARQLGPERLEGLFRDFRLLSAVDLALATAASEPDPAGIRAAPELAGIGQGELMITPLHLALATAALSRHGHMPAPHLLLATQTAQLSWRDELPRSAPATVIAQEYADAVKAVLREGYTAAALTGTEGKQVAWFTAFGPFENTRYVVTVLLEDGDTAAASRIGQAVLRAATGQ